MYLVYVAILTVGRFVTWYCLEQHSMQTVNYKNESTIKMIPIIAYANNVVVHC